jgi:hypothetical protein
VVRATEDPPRSPPTSRHLTSPLTVQRDLRRCRLAWRSPPTRSHGGSQGSNSLPPLMTDEAQQFRALPRPDGGCTAPAPLLPPYGSGAAAPSGARLIHSGARVLGGPAVRAACGGSLSLTHLPPRVDGGVAGSTSNAIAGPGRT